MEFADAFHMLFMLEHDLEKITSSKLSKPMMNDSKNICLMFSQKQLPPWKKIRDLLKNRDGSL